MIEHRRGIKQYLKDHDRDHRWPQYHNGRELDQHGEDDFNGMKARAGSDIKVEIGVMHAMQAP